MELKIETLGPCRRKLRIEVPAGRVDGELERAYAEAGRGAVVPGFRPGKAPRKVVELHYGAKVREDIKERLIEESVASALREHRLSPAVPPRLDIGSFPLSSGQPFRFEVEVEVWPEVAASGYTGIKVAKKRIEAKEEDVEGYIRMLLDRHAEIIPIEGRGLREGDLALLDISGETDGTVFDEKSAVWIETGPKSYCDGFCENLIGAAPGEVREFTLRLPAEGVREGFGGKEARFVVKVRELKEKRVPELNDEFCRGLGNCANPEELRASVRKDLLAYAEAEARDDLIRQINDYLLERHAVPLPETRAALDAVSLAQKAAGNLLARGLKKEDILERKEELLAVSRKDAEKRLALSLVYGSIARREKIAVTPAEVEARVARIAASAKREPAEVRAALEKDDRIDEIENDIAREKVEAFLLEKAKVREAR
jgi:trigger factor